MEQEEAADIVLEENTILLTRKLHSHVRLQRLEYNEKGNLSGLLGVVVTSGMIFPAMKEAIVTTARKIDPAIVDVTGDQMWHLRQVHSVNLERYDRQTGGMELLQRKSRRDRTI